MNTAKSASFLEFDPRRVPSPCFVVDKAAVESNLQILHHVQKESGATILLALKAFAMFHLAPLIGRYLGGTCASGLHEARLGREEFKGEVHTFCAAFKREEFEQIQTLSDHIVFNSISQWENFQDLVSENSTRTIKYGLRVNPLISTAETPLYDPCAPGSRLGIPLPELKNYLQSAHASLTHISGLHFHTLCEQNFDALELTIHKIEMELGDQLHKLNWINLGGGHLITQESYDRFGLVEKIKYLRQRYKLEVYLEPGEAIAINTGVLVSEVLDISENDGLNAIMDCSATCHMPDTLEMPYRAHILHSGAASEKKFRYRLGGQSCLAGDQMGEYSFDTALSLGQRLMFDDMSHYSMVKTTTFNGIQLPALAIWDSKKDELELIRQFSYCDFRDRLS